MGGVGERGVGEAEGSGPAGDAGVDTLTRAVEPVEANDDHVGYTGALGGVPPGDGEVAELADDDEVAGEDPFGGRVLGLHSADGPVQEGKIACSSGDKSRIWLTHPLEGLANRGEGLLDRISPDGSTTGGNFAGAELDAVDEEVGEASLRREIGKESVSTVVGAEEAPTLEGLAVGTSGRRYMALGGDLRCNSETMAEVIAVLGQQILQGSACG